METLLADVRHSSRVLIKSPGFTMVAVLALALGIGANTAIFSVINKVLLAPLPFKQSERMMRVARKYPNGNGNSVSIPKFEAWHKSTSFEAMAAYDFGSVSMNLGTGDKPNPVNGMHVTADFFKVFGVEPILGRTFSPEEDMPNAGKYAVLTYGAWKNRLGADQDIVGKTVTLSGEHYVVLGVLPESYEPDPPTDVYLPEQFDPNSTNQGNIYNIAGRLRSGVSIASANAEMAVIADQFRAAHPDVMDKTESIRVWPLRDAIVGGDIRLQLLIMAGAVGFVLLIACANVASLLLARASGRQREIAIRTAVGASRWRIVRQLMTESILLGLSGGVAGMVLGSVGVRLLLALSPGNLPRLNDPDHALGTVALLDWRMLVFLIGISLFTGLLFGLFPAIRVSHFDVNASLKESSSRSGTGFKHSRIGGLLVMGEIGLAVLLLAGATLMVRTFASLRSMDPGIDPHNVLTLRTAISGSRYGSTAQVESMVQQAKDRIQALPGVQTVASTVALPLESVGIDMPFNIQGRTPKLNQKWEGDEYWRFVSSGYFEALRIPLLRGRYFTRNDTGKTDHVVIINEAFAKKYWPSGDPIGQQIVIGKGLGAPFDEPSRQIVGVVGNVTEQGLSEGKVAVMYVPESQITDGLTRLAGSLLPLSWAIRTSGDPQSVAEAVRHEFESLDPTLTPSHMVDMDQVIAESNTRQNFATMLLTVFASIALLLAAVGIYGLMAYTVEQRTQEIGIRMALGANQGKIMRLVLGQGIRLAVVGTVIGLAAAYGVTRLLGKFLFGLKAGDPLAFLMVAAALIAVALLAAFVPTRRAMRVDPMIGLRQE
ncbi:MAG TPA: ABC transporter permease [Candidatus Angelobacter sp.]|nr:ABC transporter permease [Candidatus Angelobacter sp.]